MLALRAGRVFDGRQLLDRPVVLVDGDKVVGAGAAAPDTADVVDFGERATLLPGLVDFHQHLCFHGRGSLEDQVVGVTDDELQHRARAAAQRALAGGVTTLRDLGDRGWVTLALREEDGLPTILAAGPPITRPDGHCWYLGGGCATEDELVAAVRDRADRGCDLVKVMATGGALTPGWPMWVSQFSTGELRLIVDTAHAHGLPVAAHCHGVEGIERALDAGADSIEHCTFFTANGRAEPPAPLLERLAASGVTISATIGRRPDLPQLPIAEANEPTLTAARRRLHELGALVVAGTDAGVIEAKPHDVLPFALGDLVESGLSPIDGLRTLTSVAADACGRGDRAGRLAAGYPADVIAVDGDPLADPSALTDVVAVWKAGRRAR
jgi:imidazolonepropionase-like amidohydrolase